MLGMAVERKKTTVYLDAELLRALKVLAASTGRHDYEVLEDAIRGYLGTPEGRAGREALHGLLDRLGRSADLDDEQALALANAELHAARRTRRRR